MAVLFVFILLTVFQLYLLTRSVMPWVTFSSPVSLVSNRKHFLSLFIFYDIDIREEDNPPQPLCLKNVYLGSV